MKLGVLGLGAIAPFFLRAIDANPATTLTAVCDLDEAKLHPYRDLGVACFTRATALLDEAAVDAVVITLPNDQHGAIVIDALKRRIHVCCEKPLTISSSEAEEMTRAARASGATLFTAFHRRYNRNLRVLAGALPADRREVVAVTARYNENIQEHNGGEQWYLDPLRCGGGCLIDNGPNVFDALRYLFGPLTLCDATIGDVRSGAEFYATVSLASPEGAPIMVELDWALETGEVKDVVVRLRDDRVLTVDMLGGFTGFKTSLDHEYQGILADFLVAVAAGRGWRDAGPELVRLVEDAYRVARSKEVRLRMRAQDPATARVVKLLFHTRDDRGMTLSPWSSRCVTTGEVHELVTSTDQPVRPGDRVDNVGFLAFVEFGSATVLARGDGVFIGDRRIGTIRGFDECHFPNHYNIIIDADRAISAADIDLRVNDLVRFEEENHDATQARRASPESLLIKGSREATRELTVAAARPMGP